MSEESKKEYKYFGCICSDDQDYHKIIITKYGTNEIVEEIIINNYADAFRKALKYEDIFIFRQDFKYCPTEG